MPNITRSPKAKRLFVGLLVVLALCVWIAHKAYVENTDCEPEKVYQRASSPDGRWEAVVVERVCEGSFVFTAVALYEVELVPKTHAADRRVVFSTDDGGYLEHLPVVTWLGPKRVELTIMHSPLIGLQKTAAAEITISYKYKH